MFCCLQLNIANNLLKKIQQKKRRITISVGCTMRVLLIYFLLLLLLFLYIRLYILVLYNKTRPQIHGELVLRPAIWACTFGFGKLRRWSTRALSRVLWIQHIVVHSVVSVVVFFHMFLFHSCGIGRCCVSLLLYVPVLIFLYIHGNDYHHTETLTHAYTHTQTHTISLAHKTTLSMAIG